jgi:predicted phage replisome organizer
MGEVQWIKLYIDILDKWKIKKIRRLPQGNDILLIWIMLLAMAGKCNAGGMIYITEGTPFTEEDLAEELKFEVDTIKSALEAFVTYKMISYTGDGSIFVIGWEEHQNTDKLAEIRAKDRERKRVKRAQAKTNLDKSADVHGQSADSPHIEEERDEEKDLEEDFYSFNRSNVREDEDNDINLSSSEHRREYLGGIGKNVVLLSDEQMCDLLSKLSLAEFNHYVGIIAESEIKGHHYTKRTHYQAILDMAYKDRKINSKR